MPNIDTTPAVVLRRVEYGDKDLIVTLYGQKTGKIGAIAKNARASKRRFGGGLQPMRLLRAHIARRPNRDLARLDSIEVISDFPAIESDFDKISTGSYATELLRETTVELDPDPRLFESLARFFEQLGEAAGAVSIERLLHQFEYQLLLRHGAAPATSQCLRCGRSTDTMDKIYALRSGEGVVCEECQHTGEKAGVLAPETVSVLEFYAGTRSSWPDSQAESGAIQQARRFMTASVRRVIDQPLKSRDSIRTLFEAVDSS